MADPSETVRYDVVGTDAGYLVTDGIMPPRYFLGSTSAVASAIASANEHAGPVQIYLWQDGVGRLVFEKEGRGATD